MTLKQLIDESLDPKTVQNNIDILNKIKGSLTDKQQQQQIDAVISGLEAEQKEKAKVTLNKSAQATNNNETAQPTNNEVTAQVGA